MEVVKGEKGRGRKEGVKTEGKFIFSCTLLAEGESDLTITSIP